MSAESDNQDAKLLNELAWGADASVPMMFGQFLMKKGLITKEDIFNARMMQKQQNLMIGQMAREKGWINGNDVERILVYQETEKMKFGELAVEYGYLSGPQVEMLLGEMNESYVYFGEALVSLGVISDKILLENLKSFHRLKLGREAEA